MDARGTLLWAEDIFRALRGEAVLGSTSTLNDEECCKNLLKIKPKMKIKKTPSRNITPGGTMQGDSRDVVWLRKTIQGRYRNLQSQVICLAAKEAWKNSEGTAVFCVSVDLRRHMPPETIITAFLSGSIYLEVKPGDTPEKITGMLKDKLNAKREISYSRMNRLMFLMPLKVINYLMDRIGNWMHSTGHYLASGLVVNLGLVPLEKYTGGGFHPVSFFGIPTYIDVIPFFMGTIGSGKNIDVIITMNKGLADNGRIEEIMESITSQLVSE
ncbi:MAG: hypothetical protein JW807_15605 [Spirochaetes bacterium]|nr:hypothetical protein [Spirochaetota bacterium]